MQRHGDLIRPERLDVLGHLDATPVHLGTAGRLDRADDVRRGDRAEQPATLAGPGRQLHRQALELAADLLGVAKVADLPAVPRPADRRDLLLAALRPRDGEPARHQVVAAEAVLDLHHVARAAEPADLLGEDQLHLASLLSGPCWCTAAAPSRGCSSLRWPRRADAGCSFR